MEFASSGEGSLFDGRWAKRSSDEVLILTTCSPPVLVCTCCCRYQIDISTT